MNWVLLIAVIWASIFVLAVLFLVGAHSRDDT